MYFLSRLPWVWIMKTLVLCVSLCLAMSLNLKTTVECDPVNVGNGVCNPECNTEKNYFDWGDCSETCPADLIGNGVCDIPCNTEKYRFDGGDCARACK